MKARRRKTRHTPSLAAVLNPLPTPAPNLHEGPSETMLAKPVAGDDWAGLVNDLCADGGVDSRPLLDLQARYAPVIDRTLRLGNVKDWNDRQDVMQGVWITFLRILRLPQGSRGVWNPARARFSADPVATLLTRIARTRAVDFHRARVRRQRRHSAYAEDRGRFGDRVADCAETGGGVRRKTFLACTRPSAAARPTSALRRYVARVRDRVPAAVATLPEGPRRILALRTEGQTVRQIGLTIGVSPGEASRRLSDARALARQGICGALTG